MTYTSQPPWGAAALDIYLQWSLNTQIRLTYSTHNISVSHSKKRKFCDIDVIIAPQKSKTEDTERAEITDYYNFTKGGINSLCEPDVKIENGQWTCSVRFWMQMM
jgi:hypothetical protein